MQITYTEKTSYVLRLQKMYSLLWKYINEKTKIFLVLETTPGSGLHFSV